MHAATHFSESTAGWSRNYRMRHSFNSATPRRAAMLLRCRVVAVWLSENRAFPIRRHVRLAMHGGCTHCSANGTSTSSIVSRCSAFTFVPHRIASHRLTKTTKRAHCVLTRLCYYPPACQLLMLVVVVVVIVAVPLRSLLLLA